MRLSSLHIARYLVSLVVISAIAVLMGCDRSEDPGSDGHRPGNGQTGRPVSPSDPSKPDNPDDHDTPGDDPQRPEDEKTEFDFLYVIGDASGWNFDFSQKLFTDDHVSFSGFARLRRSFRLTSGLSFSASRNYGMGEKPGILADQSPHDIEAGDDGLYLITADVTALVYDMERMEYLAVIFSNGRDYEKLAPAADWLAWSANVTFCENDEWQVVCSNGMTIGDKKKSPGAGSYRVKVLLDRLPYEVKVSQ